MAFIAPALVKAAVEGRLPRGIGVANLRDAPAEWSLQFERLGLAQPDSTSSRLQISNAVRHPAATAPRRSSRHHTFSAPGTGFFAAETKVQIGRLPLPENERLEGRIGKAVRDR